MKEERYNDGTFVLERYTKVVLLQKIFLFYDEELKVTSNFLMLKCNYHFCNFKIQLYFFTFSILSTINSLVLCFSHNQFLVVIMRNACTTIHP